MTEPVRLPNFEDANDPYREFGDTPAPVGFGFIQASWQPRASFAGTYDSAWEDQRKPLLPLDFDRRFFNSASPGLIAPGYLRGDEDVVIIGASPDGRVAFRLPALDPPEIVIHLRGGSRETRRGALDTVVIDMDARTLTLLWRTHVRLRSGVHDVIAVDVDHVPEPEEITE